MSSSPSAGKGVRRREIGEGDLGAVVDLLGRGFPGRPRGYWERGFARLGGRPKVAGCPRYGFLLDDGGRTVGAVLTLFAAGRDGLVRCNLSSWTVDPDYRVHAALLVGSVLRRDGVTFSNISPAPQTWATIAAQGFVPYADRQCLVLPWPGRPAGRARVLPWPGRPAGRARVLEDPAAWRGLPEAALLDDHAGFGCRSLAVEVDGSAHPLVLVPVRARAGRWPLPLMELVFCRDVADLARFAGALGPWMLRHGAVGLVLDGDLPHGLTGLRCIRRSRKYFRGPHPPRIGDLSYTERAIFGP